MAQPNFILIFNNQFSQFIDDILSIFPNDVDILSAKNSLNLIRKTNPKLLINIWHKYVVIPYKEQINESKTAAEAAAPKEPLVNESFANDLVNRVKFNLGR